MPSRSRSAHKKVAHKKSKSKSRSRSRSASRHGKGRKLSAWNKYVKAHFAAEKKKHPRAKAGGILSKLAVRARAAGVIGKHHKKAAKKGRSRSGRKHAISSTLAEL